MNKLVVVAVLCGAFVSVAADRAFAQESLTLSFDTTPVGGNYAPRNVLAVWIEDAAGNFVKTINRWANRRAQHLVAWEQASGGANVDVDAVSGATRSSHNANVAVSWDLKDSAGQLIPDGIYTIRMEVADRNSNSPDQNNQGTFAFEKNGMAATQTVSGGGFQNVIIAYNTSPVDPVDPNPPTTDPVPANPGTINAIGGCSYSGNSQVPPVLLVAAILFFAFAIRRRRLGARNS